MRKRRDVPLESPLGHFTSMNKFNVFISEGLLIKGFILLVRTKKICIQIFLLLQRA
jgi:hypothetical protein